MRELVHFCRLALCGVVAGVLVLPTASMAQRPVIPDETTDRILLSPHVEYLEDPGGSWSIEEVSSKELSSRFRRSTTETPNFGFTRSAYWFRFALQGGPGTDRHWLLELGHPLLDRIEFYVPKEGDGFLRQIAGDHYPFEQRVFHHRNFVFPLELHPGETRVFYLRTKSESAIQVPLTLWTSQGFSQQNQRANVTLGLFYGLLLLMILYNLFLYFAVVDLSYLYFVLFVCGGFFTLSSLDGLAQQFLWPAFPWWGNHALPMAVLLACLGAALFARRFLSTKQHLPRWNAALSILSLIAGSGAILTLFIPYLWAIIPAVLMAVVTAIIAVSVGIHSMLRGQKIARYYLMAWSVFAFGACLVALNRLGIFPKTDFTEHTLHIGLALMGLLLSFALADRINFIRWEKDSAQARALQIQRQAAENLELEVKKRTQELEEAYDRLAEHDRLKSRFFANVSHELRTPLTLILTPLERLLARDFSQDPDGTRQQLHAMVGNTQRLLRLVNQLLDFSRLESGSATVAFELRDIRTMVEALVQGFTPFARSKELTLEVRVPEELPRVYVDPGKLDKTISNLLSNACKFTGTGGTVLVPITSDDRTVKIAIKDTGIGIAEKDLSRIFERFHQVDGSAARRYEGTGIGLALSKELVELMGGTLEVQSDLGVGSTFTVTLPLGKEHIQDPSLIRPETAGADTVARAEAAATALAAEMGLRERAASAGETGTDTVGDREQEDPSRPLLLVVEDNPDLRALVADICQDDFSIMEAENGRVGLDMIQEFHPAIVVLDVMMSEMDGYEVLRSVRADPATATLPVIMLTAKVGPEMKLEGLESGADDYLPKPFESRELLARARNLVRLQRQERQLRETNARLQQEVVEQSMALEQARALQRYLPPEVARTALETGTPVQVGQERRRLTVFRLELRGIGKLVVQVDPEDMATLINAYLSEMVEVAFSHGATVDKFIRDTVVGFVGAPRSEGPENDALRCARLAIDMFEHATVVCRRWEGLLKGCAPPLPTLVLASGHATVGNFGSSHRLEYTAMGGPVDEAAEIVHQIDPGQVICSQSAWALLRGHLEGQMCGDATVTGSSQPVKLYRIAGPLEDAGAAAAETVKTPPAPSETGAAWHHPSALAAGMVIAERYTIVRPLGEGGMGTVYKARDLKLGSDVALKLLKLNISGDDSRRARLYREVRLAQMVSHRNVARIYDLQTWQDREFISMEYIQGQTLAERLHAGWELDAVQGCDLLLQICAGLAAAHAANIVHRDLKPANIMVQESGRVVIMDFGIARWSSVLHQTAEDTRGIVGSPHYMAPEQFQGARVDQRADIYALGVVAYEMFTGRKPFEAENSVVIAYKHTHEPPPDPIAIRPDLPQRLAAVILRCMEKSPDRRFSSVVEIRPLLEGKQSVQNTATNAVTC